MRSGHVILFPSDVLCISSLFSFLFFALYLVIQTNI
nr:MAG TPA: hypothetical protein [Bacteriophage sp.]